MKAYEAPEKVVPELFVVNKVSTFYYFQPDFVDTIPKSIPMTIGKSLSGKGATIGMTNRKRKKEEG